MEDISITPSWPQAPPADAPMATTGKRLPDTATGPDLVDVDLLFLMAMSLGMKVCCVNDAPSTYQGKRIWLFLKSRQGVYYAYFPDSSSFVPGITTLSPVIINLPSTGRESVPCVIRVSAS